MKPRRTPKRRAHTETFYCGLHLDRFLLNTLTRDRHDTELLTKMGYGPNAEVVKVKVVEVLPRRRVRGGKR